MRAIDSELLQERQSTQQMRETVAKSESLASEEKAYIDAVIAYRAAEKQYDRALRKYDSLVSHARGQTRNARRDYERAMKVKTHKEAQQYIRKAKRYRSMALNVQRAERDFERSARDLDLATAKVDETSKKLIRKRKDLAARRRQEVNAAAVAVDASAEKVAVAIEGFDPVAYFKVGEASKGLPEIHCKWHGRTWYFVNEENRQYFLDRPELFAPQFDGHCAWAMAQGRIVPGDPTVWKVFDNKLYLHQSLAVQTGWVLEVEKNLSSAMRFWRELDTRE